MTDQISRSASLPSGPAPATADAHGATGQGSLSPAQRAAMDQLGFRTDGERWWREGAVYKSEQHALTQARRLTRKIVKALRDPEHSKEE